MCLTIILFLTVLQKLGHRLAALGKTGWTESTLSEVRSVLTLDYTSSDESCYECPSDSEEVQLTSYKTKRLQWERSRLTKAKKVLDLTYERTLTRRIRLSRVPRELSEEMSDREIPSNVIEWAVRRPVLVAGGVSRTPSTSASSTRARSSTSHSMTFDGDRVLDPLHSSTPRSARQH